MRIRRPLWAVLAVTTLCMLALPARAATEKLEAPQWARTRAFPTTRAWIVPANTLIAAFDADAVIGTTDANYVRENARYGMWLGLGHRLALEAALRVTAFQAVGTLVLNQQTVDVRWAWADWGVLGGNPTLSVGVAFNSQAAPSVSAQLNFADGWGRGPWAVNLSFARQLRGAALTQTYGLTAAMAYTWDDASVDAGLELYARLNAGQTSDGTGARFAVTDGTFLGGPYVRWTPVPQASVVFEVGAGALVTWPVGEQRTTIPAVQPKLTFAWSL